MNPMSYGRTPDCSVHMVISFDLARPVLVEYQSCNSLPQELRQHEDCAMLTLSRFLMMVYEAALQILAAPQTLDFPRMMSAALRTNRMRGSRSAPGTPALIFREPTRTLVCLTGKSPSQHLLNPLELTSLCGFPAETPAVLPFFSIPACLLAGTDAYAVTVAYGSCLIPISIQSGPLPLALCPVPISSISALYARIAVTEQHVDVGRAA